MIVNDEGLRLCSVCEEPLFTEEFSENVKPELAILSPPYKDECQLCYFKRVDIDKELNPKEHEEFIEEETERRRKKWANNQPN
jgi:hypothetical protein